MTAMNDKTLLPCPFCGGEAYTTDSDNKWFVSCHDCYACVGEGYDADAWPDHMFYSKAEAIAAWNTRAPQATRIEVLQAALRECATAHNGYAAQIIAKQALENSDAE